MVLTDSMKSPVLIADEAILVDVELQEHLIAKIRELGAAEPFITIAVGLLDQFVAFAVLVLVLRILLFDYMSRCCFCNGLKLRPVCPDLLNRHVAIRICVNGHEAFGLVQDKFILADAIVTIDVQQLNRHQSRLTCRVALAPMGAHEC